MHGDVLITTWRKFYLFENAYDKPMAFWYKTLKPFIAPFHKTLLTIEKEKCYKSDI
jgi:hypothetical protein